MTSSVDGLVSGMDTTSIINQLMQLERQPQVRLQQTRTNVQKAADAYRALNTKFDALEKAAEALKSSGWTVAKVSSSNEAVATAAASSTASRGTLTFTVGSLVSSHIVASNTGVAATNTALTDDGTGAFSLTVNGTTYGLTATTNSLDGVIAAINGSTSLPFTAAAMQLSPGVYSLELLSKTSGSASTFTIDATTNLSALGTIGTVIAQGADASLTTASGATITSTTNTFTDLLPGVTVTARATGSATITLTDDPDALAAKAQKYVDALNDVVGYIKSQSAYDATAKKAGVLMGDSLVRTLQSDLVTDVTGAVGASTLGSAGAAGIGVDRNGTFTFDRTKFLDAYRSNGAEVQKLFADPVDGIAERVGARATKATEYGTGQITQAIAGKDSQVKWLGDQIDDWDDRLAVKEQALRRQFSALETALGKLRDQSTWLAGQLAGLGSSS